MFCWAWAWIQVLACPVHREKFWKRTVIQARTWGNFSRQKIILHSLMQAHLRIFTPRDWRGVSGIHLIILRRTLLLSCGLHLNGDPVNP